MKQIKVIPNNPGFEGMAEVSGPIVFSSPDGQPLTLHLITPWNRSRTYPLVVFIQGSGWTSPNRGMNLPHLCDIAREGFVVATVTHRSCNDGHPFPAFLVDVKSAIRFLRANAAEYCMDPSRVAAYGTSSGGNTALLLAMTANDPRYKNEVYPEQSDAVDCMAECFGPTDLMTLFTDKAEVLGEGEREEGMAYFMRIIGHDWRTPEGEKAAHDMSPACILQEGMELPPMLMLHGDADDVVPFEQSEKLFDRLCELGHEVDLIRITGAEHEGTFWTEVVRADVTAFLKKHLQ